MSSRRSSLDIVIVNWNVGEYLRACLESICLAGKNGFDLNRVIVVDNASSDGSLENIRQLNLPITLIRNAKNEGFAVACNQGAFGSSADYLLFLNPDTVLFPESLERPVQFLDEPANGDVGICGIKLVDENGAPVPACARFPAMSVFLSQMFGLSVLSPKIFQAHILPPRELLFSRKVDQIIGAFFLIRRNLFEKLNGFDQRFFVYFEEVDLSIRARHEGYVSYYLAEVIARHAGRVSSRQASSMSLYYSLSSRLKYALKHFRHWEALLLILLTFSVEFVTRVVWSAFGSSVVGVRDVFSAYKQLAFSFISGEYSWR